MFGQGDWKTGAGSGDAGDSPTVREPPRAAGEVIERELIPVRHDEVLGQVPSGEGAGASVVEGIDNIGDARRLIERLTVGVGQDQVEPPVWRRLASSAL